jgi:DNA-binding transcriptional LysR family regulator
VQRACGAAGFVPIVAAQCTDYASTLALVRAGVGVALVPDAAEKLQFRGVALRPLTDAQQRAAELYFVWRDDNDNPLLPVIASIARVLAGGV